MLGVDKYVKGLGGFIAPKHEMQNLG